MSLPDQAPKEAKSSPCLPKVGETGRIHLKQDATDYRTQLRITSPGGTVVRLMLDRNSTMLVTAGGDIEAMGFLLTCHDDGEVAMKLRLTERVLDSNDSEANHGD